MELCKFYLCLLCARFSPKKKKKLCARFFFKTKRVNILFLLAIKYLTDVKLVFYFKMCKKYKKFMLPLNFLHLMKLACLHNVPNDDMVAYYYHMSPVRDDHVSFMWLSWVKRIDFSIWFLKLTVYYHFSHEFNNLLTFWFLNLTNTCILVLESVFKFSIKCHVAWIISIEIAIFYHFYCCCNSTI